MGITGAPPNGIVSLNGARAYIALHGVRANGCCDCGRALCTSIGKHPIRAGWQQDVHTLEELSEHRGNLGIVTGAASNLCALDIDAGGAESLEQLEQELGSLPETLTVRTGSGGRHLYFAHPGQPVRNRVAVRPGIDVRGDGAFCVAPGSRHASGGRYQLERDMAPASLPLLWLALLCPPERIRAKVHRPTTTTSSRYAQSALERELAVLSGAPEGTRNHQLNVASFNLGQLAGSGLLERTVLEQSLLEVALKAGLENDESVATIKSGLDDGAEQPRGAPVRTRLELVKPATQDTDPPSKTQPGGSSSAVSAAAADSVSYLDLPAIAVAGVPAVPWIVEGWVAEGDIVLAAGDGGIGKSTTIGALAVAVASGGSWCGLPVTRAGPVLVFDEEQSERELSRMYLRLGAGACPLLRVASQQSLNLATRDGLSRVERELREHRPLLVICDSVQQMFAGVDGNDAAAVAQVYRELFRLRRDYQTSFLLIGHLRKPSTGGPPTARHHQVFGSVAFGTQASTVWVAEQPARGLMDLFQTKRRDGERTSMRIRYQSEGADAPIVLLGEGAIEEQETVAERAQEFVVSYLAEKGVSPTGWIVSAAAEGSPPIPERTIKRALAHLAKLGRVEKPQYGYYGLTGPPAGPSEPA